MIVHADCLEHMRTMDANSVDAIVTDPPYGLSFMGKGWDKGVPGIEFWRAAITVLKPGAYLLAFGGTRTFHRMAVAIEDAGFEIHDTISWLYGSGFPKHKSKLKPAWEPIIVARKPAPKATPLNVDACRIEGGERPLLESTPKNGKFSGVFREGSRAVGATNFGRWPANVVLDDEAAALLDAQSGTLTTNPGTSRKVYAPGMYGPPRQPGTVMSTGDTGGASRFFLTVAQDRSSTYNVEEQECASCGSESTEDASTSAGKRTEGNAVNSLTAGCGNKHTDLSPTDTKSTTRTATHSTTTSPTLNVSPLNGTTIIINGFEKITESSTALSTDAANDATNTSRSMDSNGASQEPIRGTASSVRGNTSGNGEPKTESTTTHTCVPIESGTDNNRFFYTAKASRSERNAGLDGMPERIGTQRFNASDLRYESGRAPTPRAEQSVNKNHHPTVKPISLMRWLVRLVTPPGGVVLDPFAGSGTTGCAAALEGFDFIGIEREAEYVAIAERRIAHWSRQPLLIGGAA